MHIRRFLLILLTFATAFSCKELPTFDPGGNDPENPDFRVRPVQSFEVMRDVTDMDTQLFWKPDMSYPFDGAIIEVGSENQFQHFRTVPKSEIEKGSFFLLEFHNIPYQNTDFKIRMYYVHNGDTLFSEPDTASLNQSLFDFRTKKISESEYSLSWKNNFMEKATVEIASKTSEDNFKILASTDLTGYLSARTNSVTLNSTESNDGSELYFRVSDPMRSQDFIPINLNKEVCIETIGDKKFFVPEDITYNKKSIPHGREIIIEWTGDCTFDEIRVYWDHGNSLYTLHDRYLPMQQIFSTKENSGTITFQTSDFSRFRLWVTVVIDGEETELTLPGVPIWI